MIDRSSNASRIVEKLKQENWVNRTKCASYGGHTDITITEQGLALLKGIDVKIDYLDHQFFNITIEEAKEVNRILDKLRS
jgi:DNA-binding MarR family transcriptional regulator